MLLLLICALTAGLAIKFMGGIPTQAPYPPTLILVKVDGAVKEPGWHKVPQGSFLKNLIDEAGGTLPWANLSGINLSSPLSSNTVYHIPEGKLNLNKALINDLTHLPGIGPELARRIVAYREKIGGFEELSQVKEVSGIGEVRFQNIKDKLTVQDKEFSSTLSQEQAELTH
ncbi:helix-hairpin-helix domain-containing protein [Candidatus Aerophobetes bacterium]|nr:helix-hairpin-helix domain-containing protein [Candidatus Aerophobetes bacterium]